MRVKELVLQTDAHPFHSFIPLQSHNQQHQQRPVKAAMITQVLAGAWLSMCAVMVRRGAAPCVCR